MKPVAYFTPDPNQTQSQHLERNTGGYWVCFRAGGRVGQRRRMGHLFQEALWGLPAASLYSCVHPLLL